MRILYINHYAGSLERGMEFRPYYLAREWQRLGHEVAVVCGSYSHLRRENFPVSDSLTRFDVEGVPYYVIRTRQYDGNGRERALSMADFMQGIYRHSSRLVLELRPDIVISSSTYPLESYPVARLARLAGATYVHEVHDMWPETLIELGGMKRSHPFVLAMARGEHHAYSRSDYVISLLPHTLDYMLHNGLSDPARWICIPNGVAPSDWQSTQRIPAGHRSVLDRIRGSGRLIAGYAGGFALSDHLDILLDAAARTQDLPLAYVLVGDGAEKPALLERVAEEGLANVYILDPVTKAAIPDLLRRFDSALVVTSGSPLYRFGLSPNKVYEYMMAALPVVWSVPVEDTIVDEAGCGFCVPAGDEPALLSALRRLTEMDEAERLAMGLRGRDKILEQYTVDRLAGRFLEFISAGRGEA